MTRVCELLIIQKTGQIVAGHLVLKDGEVVARPAPGYEKFCNGFLDDSLLVKGGKGRVTHEEDPEGWFAALPLNYNGTYLRANILPA